MAQGRNTLKKGIGRQLEGEKYYSKLVVQEVEKMGEDMKIKWTLESPMRGKCFEKMTTLTRLKDTINILERGVLIDIV